MGFGTSSPQPMWKDDLSDRFDAMIVKELRQGMRRGIFIYPFVALHILTTLALVIEFSVDEPTAYSDYVGVMNIGMFFPGGLYSGPFWGVVGFICIVLAPMGAFVMMTKELDSGNYEILLLTPLSRWKVVKGKFVAIWGMCLVMMVSLLPYVIVRYVFGGMDIWRNIALTLTVFFGAAVVAAGCLGASSYPKMGGRILIFLLYLSSACFCGGVALGASIGVSEGAGVFYHLNALAFVFCFVSIGLSLARSRIRVKVHSYEMKPSGLMIGMLFMTPFVVGMAALMTLGFGGGLGLIGMGIMAIFCDTTPKASKAVVVPSPNIPKVPDLPSSLPS